MQEHTVDKNLEQVAFLLSNKRGGYAMFSGSHISRFFGLYFNLNFKMFKVLEDVKIKNSAGLSKLKLKHWCVERTRKGGGGLKETFFMPYGHNALVYELSSPREIEFIFDIRETYDNRNFGRNYSIEREGNKLIVSYRKNKDYREDGADGTSEYIVYACVAFPDKAFEYEKAEQWYPVEYDFDRKRNSSPWGKFVFNAFSAKTGFCVLTFSDSRKNAIEEADFVMRHLHILKKKQEDVVSSNLRFAHGKKIMSQDQQMALKCSVNAVHNLTSVVGETAGMHAGLPWFFQFWSRDEAISMQSLILSGGREFAKEIIMRQLGMIDEKGFTAAQYPANSIASADSLGWLCKRIHQNINKFTSEEKEIIYQKLKIAADRLIKNATHGKLALNEPKATWMDTDFAGDSRAGARIEIQAMRLMLYKLMKELVVNPYYKKFYTDFERNMREKVRRIFWNGKYLKDGSDDSTIRPNVFIAYYIYPELLEDWEWKICFENALKALWLDWGGLSSIDKKHSLFCDTYTGEDPKSYHRGDSWYWINNLAALCMFRLDKDLFAKYIHEILNRSTKEILYNGVIGSHAELSSAKEPKSQGCLAQLWSSAMYIELMDEMF